MNDRGFGGRKSHRDRLSVRAGKGGGGRWGRQVVVVGKPLLLLFRITRQIWGRLMEKHMSMHNPVPVSDKGHIHGSQKCRKAGGGVVGGPLPKHGGGLQKEAKEEMSSRN